MAERATVDLSAPQTVIRNTTKALNLNMAGQRSGKSQMIGVMTGEYSAEYPTLKGFIGANTYMQLVQSTLVKVFEVWRDWFGMTPYHAKRNPLGHFVVNVKPPAHFKQFDIFADYNNVISFLNGHVIFIGSLENYKAHDGKEFAYAHLDETKDTKEEAVTSVILARLSQRGLFIDPFGEKHYVPDYLTEKGKAKIKFLTLKGYNPAWIHTSPAIGQVDWLIKMFRLDEQEQEIRRTITNFFPNGEPDFYHYEFDNKCVVIFSTYHNAENLPDGYIENRLFQLSENEIMKFIFGYPFSKTGGEYFPNFSRMKHVTDVPFVDGITGQLTFDFNVLPYMTLIAGQLVFVDRYLDKNNRKFIQWKEERRHIRVMQIRIYKEYCLAIPLNSVEACCAAYSHDMEDKTNAGVYIYGDAGGRKRVEGLGSYTNLKEIESRLIKFTHSSSVRMRKQNIGVHKRRDMMNRIFEGKVPEIEIYIDKNCTQTIRDLEFVKQGKDGKLKEEVKDPVTGAKYQKIGHTSDALEYMVCELAKDIIKD